MKNVAKIEPVLHEASEAHKSVGAVTRVIAVTSGKGGVGKTSTVANLAVALSRMGKRVLVLDADLGLGNIDVLLGLSPRYNIGHVLRGEKTVEEVIVDGPAGVKILPATFGIQELTNLGTEQRIAITSHLENLGDNIDFMIIDTGAGISSNVLFFNVAAHEIVVVVSPEPTSVIDAYALMKVLLRKHGERRFSLLVNTVRSPEEGLEVYKKISLAASRFMSVSLDYLGCVLYDENVRKAVVNRMAVVEMAPDSLASRCYEQIASKLASRPADAGPKGGLQLFWNRVIRSQV